MQQMVEEIQKLSILIFNFAIRHAYETDWEK